MCAALTMRMSRSNPLQERLPATKRRRRKGGDRLIFVGNRKYELIYENKTAWNAEVFRDRYSDVLERYDYIVGDWGYSQLRLKGFYRDDNPKAGRDTAYSGMMEYINEYCNFGCAYFIMEMKGIIGTDADGPTDVPGAGDIVIVPGVRRFESDSYSRTPAADRRKGADSRSGGDRKRGTAAGETAADSEAREGTDAEAAEAVASSGDRRGPRREQGGRRDQSGGAKRHGGAPGMSGGNRRGERREAPAAGAAVREAAPSGEPQARAARACLRRRQPP